MLFPTATLFRSTINVPLYAAAGEKAGEVQIYAAAFFIPSGTWTLIWNLTTLDLDADSGPFTFDAVAGVELRLFPIDGLAVLWEKRVGPTQWAICLENTAKEVSTMTYAVTLDGASGTRLHPFDPSVVVTPDPIEPPT